MLLLRFVLALVLGASASVFASEHTDAVGLPPEADSGDGGEVTLIAWWNGGSNDGLPPYLASFRADARPSFDGLKEEIYHGLRKALDIPEDEQQPLVPLSHVLLYNQYGLKITPADVAKLQDADEVYLLRKGEIFFWPGGDVGHETQLRSVRPPEGRTKPLVMVTRALQPRVFTVDDFLSTDEIAALKAEIDTRYFVNSALANSSADPAENYHEVCCRRPDALSSPPSQLTHRRARLAVHRFARRHRRGFPFPTSSPGRVSRTSPAGSASWPVCPCATQAICRYARGRVPCPPSPALTTSLRPGCALQSEPALPLAL